MISILGTAILTDLLNALLGPLQAGPELLKSRAGGILSVLIAIELAWAGISIALSGGDSMWKHLLTKLIKCGVWALIVMEYPLIVEELRDFFLDSGSAAGGGGGGVAMLLDPSAVADMGFKATLPIWEMMESQEQPIFSGFSPGALASSLVIICCGLSILVLYYVIAISIFMATVEFYVVAAVGIILVPWGVNDNTKFIAEKFMGAMVAMGVKLMVISFLCTVTLPVLKGFQVPADPSFAQVFQLLLGVMTVAVLNWRAPNVASALMAGSASLTASDTLGVAAQAGGAAAQAGGAVASGGSTVVAQGAKMGAQMGTSAISSAASLHGNESGSSGMGRSAVGAASNVAGVASSSSASVSAGSDMSAGAGASSAGGAGASGSNTGGAGAAPAQGAPSPTTTEGKNG